MIKSGDNIDTIYHNIQRDIVILSNEIYDTYTTILNIVFPKSFNISGGSFGLIAGKISIDDINTYKNWLNYAISITAYNGSSEYSNYHWYYIRYLGMVSDGTIQFGIRNLTSSTTLTINKLRLRTINILNKTVSPSKTITLT